MRKFLTVLAVVGFGLTASGCSEWIQRAMELASSVARVTVKVHDAVTDGCATIGRYEVQAELAASRIAHCRPFHVRVVQVRSGVAAFCNNIALVSDAVAGNYVKKVQQELKGLSAIKPEGC